MPSLFEDPFIEPIDRDAILKEGKSKTLGKYTKDVGKGGPGSGASQLDQLVIDNKVKEGFADDIGLEKAGTIIGLDGSIQELEGFPGDKTLKTGINHPVIQDALRRLQKLSVLANVVRDEARIILKRHIVNMDRDLTKYPDEVIDAINFLTLAKHTNDPDDPDKNAKTEICEGALLCIAACSTIGGEHPSVNEIDDNLQKFEQATDLADAVNKFSGEKFFKMSGWDMFMFMVKFIVAYTVHMILGFLCCYFRDKLIIDLGVTEYRAGHKIAGGISKAERFLKKELGYPCRDSKDPAKCVDNQGRPTIEVFSLFPCCQADVEKKDTKFSSCDKDGNLRIDDPSMDNLRECYAKAVEDMMLQEFGIGAKRMCPDCSGEPAVCKPIHQKMADFVMSSFAAMSTASESDGHNEFNSTGTASQNYGTAGKMNNIAQHAGNLSDKLSNAIALNSPFINTANQDICDLDASAGLGSLFKPLGEITTEDIQNALLDNIDKDITQFLKTNRDEPIGIESCSNPEPTIEPFKSICGIVILIDRELTAVLKEARKYLGALKALEGITISRDFCCIVFTLVFIGNLVRFAKLCPEEDLASLFNFADNLKVGKDLDKVLCEIEFLKELIDALQSELLEDINITGVGLPLGTLIEILKKVVSNIIIALASIALAPLQKLLKDLENAPSLKELLNENCFGIGDLLTMIQCGIQWLLDLIKEWAEDLIPISATNMQLIPDMRISSMRFAFLGQLKNLLDLLIDLLVNIGDCYTPEVISETIINNVEEAALDGTTARFIAEEKVKSENIPATGPGVTSNSFLFGDIKMNYIPPDGTKEGKGVEMEVDVSPIPAILEELDKMPLVPGVLHSTTLGGTTGRTSGVRTFPIYPAEMIRFKRSISQNTIPLSEIGEIDEFGKIIFNAEELENIIGGGVSREKAKKSLLNMVDTLLSLKKEPAK